MKTKSMTQAVLLISLAASYPTAFAQDAVVDQTRMEKKDTVQPGSLTAIIADSATFSTLTKALKATELDLTIGVKGEFTIFAPTRVVPKSSVYF